MSTVTSPPDKTGPTPASSSSGRPRLSGMTWLVWRQHRSAYWTMLGAMALLLGWMIYQRGRMTDFLADNGLPREGAESMGAAFVKYSEALESVGFLLSAIPLLLGVFVGAPLLAQDLEHGTAGLVATQSTSRRRWLATKLGVTALVVVVVTVSLSVAYGWWLNPVKDQSSVVLWSTGFAFDTTGPVPVALTLLTVVGGAAIGLVLRRTLAAMAFTMTFAVAVLYVWDSLRISLGDPVTLTTDKGVIAEDSFPTLSDSAHVTDESYLTGAGDLLGWSTCATEPSEQARETCLNQADVIGWSVDYVPITQMPTMQWLGASILFALTAAITVFLFTWGRRRLV
ncbi:ABC transporter [Streptomyces sp. NPDC059477]|uniref:ABC transporter n=1 Tax=Streptomyces sp. NPDC059477 TaxID=3346847 RepID=UPI0036859FEB